MDESARERLAREIYPLWSKGRTWWGDKIPGERAFSWNEIQKQLGLRESVKTCQRAQ